MVGYLNTMPFRWALEDQVLPFQPEITYAIPSICSDLMKAGEVSLSLMPFGSTIGLDYQTVTDTCIACDGAVRTVCIFSQKRIEDVHTIYLDTHSRTSNLLVQIILHDYFNRKDVRFKFYQKDYLLEEGEARLMIGDKVFGNEGHYAYSYDLGTLWKKMTGLPFVFAVWCMSPHAPVEEAYLAALDKAIKDELTFLEKNLSFKMAEHNLPVDLELYYRRHISYELGKDKRMAMQLFEEKIRSADYLV